jgi:CheY-like chemotaxis protein
VAADLGGVIQDMAKGLRPVLRENVRLDVLPSREPVVARVDVALFQQAVLNLVLNARDAMPQGGRLSIETAWVEPTPRFVARYGGTALGPYARVTVRDTGTGMDDEVLRRLFEPFFTTKPAGRGTGLGLAMTQGFVKQSGGFLHVESQKAKGTAVEIYLPCVAEKAAPPRPPHTDAMPGGKETILLVEDEHAVRHLLAETLREAGYTVLEAAGAADALPLAERFAEQIHLILSDVILSGMEGPELAGRVRQVRPDIRALFVSGYSGGASLRPGTAGGDAPLITKPLNFPEFLATVRRVLDRSVRAESPSSVN